MFRENLFRRFVRMVLKNNNNLQRKQRLGLEIYLITGFVVVNNNKTTTCHLSCLLLDSVWLYGSFGRSFGIAEGNGSNSFVAMLIFLVSLRESHNA